MANVSLRRGDTLNIVWTATHKTPLGRREVESYFVFSYDELMARLQSVNRRGRSKKSGTEGAKFSRVVSLVCNSIRKGRWATGVEIDRDRVFSHMIKQYTMLDKSELRNITDNAKTSLLNLHYTNPQINGKHRRELLSILDDLEISNHPEDQLKLSNHG